MSINNSPVLNANAGLSQFRFWCQKVLPLVYDDSLSYYETLCKIANKLNEAITSANTSQDNIVLLKQAYDELLEYINEYTKTLDASLVEKVNEALNNMAQSGELFDYVVRLITPGDIGAATVGFAEQCFHPNGQWLNTAEGASVLDLITYNGGYRFTQGLVLKGLECVQLVHFNTLVDDGGRCALEIAFGYNSSDYILFRWKWYHAWSEWKVL